MVVLKLVGNLQRKDSMNRMIKMWASGGLVNFT
jgi:hypothetical protein